MKPLTLGVGTRILIISALCIFPLIVRCSKLQKYESDFEFDDHLITQEKNSKLLSGSNKKTWIFEADNELCQVLKCKKNELCLLEDEFTAVCVNKKDIHQNGDKIVTRTESKIKKEEKVKSKNDQKSDYDDEDVKNNAETSDDYYDEDDDGEDEELDNEYFPKNNENEQSILTATTKKSCPTCPMVTRPLAFLCGSDNRTYSSECRLKYHNCVHKENVKETCTGFCPCKTKSAKDEKERLKKKYEKEMLSNGGVEAEHVIRKQKKYQEFKKSIENDTNSYSAPSPLITLKNTSIKKADKKVKFEKVKNYRFDNEVIKSGIKFGKDCSESGLESIGNRLLDWFSVIMWDREGKSPKKEPYLKDKYKNVKFAEGCKKEVVWMFGHLNTNGDEELSSQELKNIKNDEDESCIKPFIDKCETNGDLVLSKSEWCNCFKKTERPCSAIRKRLPNLLGAYVPDCDDNGFYKTTQCHHSIRLCWCVDKHGVEFANTRTKGSRPNCDSFASSGSGSSNNGDSDLEDDDDEDFEGSGSLD